MPCSFLHLLPLLWQTPVLNFLEISSFLPRCSTLLHIMEMFRIRCCGNLARTTLSFSPSLRLMLNLWLTPQFLTWICARRQSILSFLFQTKHRFLRWTRTCSLSIRFMFIWSNCRVRCVLPRRNNAYAFFPSITYYRKCDVDVGQLNGSLSAQSLNHVINQVDNWLFSFDAAMHADQIQSQFVWFFFFPVNMTDLWFY